MDIVEAKLIQFFKDFFPEVENDIFTHLRSNNPQHEQLCKRRSEILKQYPSVQAAVDDGGGGGISLNAEEHMALLEYLQVKDDCDSMERLEIYFRGHADCMAYLKRIGAL